MVILEKRKEDIERVNGKTGETEKEMNDEKENIEKKSLNS